MSVLVKDLETLPEDASPTPGAADCANAHIAKAQQRTGADKPALLPHHETLIRESSIALEVARARGYRSVATKAELRGLGFSAIQCRVPALLIPVWGVAGEIATYQIRPDEPRIKDGKPLKYETPQGSRMTLDVPPGARRWLRDPNRPLVITEGARKADAAVSKGLCCVALLGVWNWRGTNDHGGKVALADWEQVALNGRTVCIAFDSDVMTKPPVHQAMARLKAFLESRGAGVLLIYLPPGDGGAKVGLDDYLAAGHSAEELLALASPDLPPVHDASGPEPDHSYRATETGLVWLKPTHDGVAPVPLTNFTARITSQIVEDDGAELGRFLEIEGRLDGRVCTFSVSASQFAGMNWPLEHLGANAVVYAGFGLRDHARTAVQLLSGAPEVRRIYTHTGWREIDGAWLYLHAGGAIGPDGQVDGVEVRLPEALARFELPAPPAGAELVEAVRASLKILDLAPDAMTVPLFAAVWLTAIRGADMSLHLAGSTGAGKTEVAALAQQHWGASMDARHLPASWLSTGNALEGLAFAAKDALLVVDDFAPTGTAHDIARQHREADRALRAQGNAAGRQRMRSDTTLRPPKPPRGLTLSTGEDVPRGQSLRARMLVLELDPDALDWKRLTAAQADAAAGLYSRALSGFLGWLAPHYRDIIAGLHAEVTTLREAAYRSAMHRRTPDIIAKLAAGLRHFLAFAQEAGVVSAEEAKALWARGWRTLSEAAAAQAAQQVAADPVGRFLELLAGALASGRAHVAGPDGGEPENAAAWGWQQSSRGDWRPRGDLIGWADDVNLFLEPQASYAVAQVMARDHGDALPISQHTLAKRLSERGMLVSKEEGRKRLTVRPTLAGARRTVLHLLMERLMPQRPSQTSQTAHSCTDEEDDGPVGGTVSPVPGLRPSRESFHHDPLSENELSSGDALVGQLGLLGRSAGIQGDEKEAGARAGSNHLELLPSVESIQGRMVAVATEGIATPSVPCELENSPEEWREAYEERFAIMTVDGQLPLEEARRQALECVKREFSR